MRIKKKKSKPPIVINGQALPRKFLDADIYGENDAKGAEKWYVAIAKDGKHYYQVLPDKKVNAGRITHPGKLTLDDFVLEYERPIPGRQIIKADLYLENGTLYIGKKAGKEEYKK